MPVDFNLNVTYGLKPQVSSLKIVTEADLGGGCRGSAPPSSPAEMKLSSYSYSGQWRHSLEVHPLLRKILDPSLCHCLQTIHFPVASHYTTRTASHLVRSTKLSPVRWRSHLDAWPTTNTTCCNNLFFLSFPFEGDIKDCRTPQPCVMSFFLFLSYLFLISPCPHSRVYLQYRTIVQMNSQIRPSNSSQFSWLLVV